MADVCISYSRADRERAEKIVAALETRGISAGSTGHALAFRR